MNKVFVFALNGCFITGLVLLVSCPNIIAATLHVPADYTTIQAAIDATSDGDTILIAPGTYVENLVIQSKGIALVGTGGAAVTIIRGATFGPIVLTNNYTTQSATTLQELTITGGHANYGAGLLAGGNPSVVVTDCVFDDNHSSYGYMGAAILGWNPPLIIERCRFTNNDQQGDRQFLAGVISLINGARTTVRNCIFWRNGTRAVNLYTASPPTVIENNTMIDNEAGLYVGYGQSHTDIAIRNNIIVGNLYGIETFYAWTYTLTTFTNNLVFSNTTDFYNADVNPIGTNGNISVAPRLVNISAGDFHLAPGSPAIDAGTAVGAPLDDIERTARPMDGNGDGLALFDIGAYEARGNAFNLCIQDESSGDVLRFNSTTGAYQIIRCRNGFTLSGTARLTRRGCTLTAQDISSDHRIMAQIDTCSNRATASIQIFSQGGTFTLTDRNITNNSCQCPNSN